MTAGDAPGQQIEGSVQALQPSQQVAWVGVSSIAEPSISAIRSAKDQRKFGSVREIFFLYFDA